jgi:hypothetical protein
VNQLLDPKEKQFPWVRDVSEEILDAWFRHNINLFLIYRFSFNFGQLVSLPELSHESILGTIASGYAQDHIYVCLKKRKKKKIKEFFFFFFFFLSRDFFFFFFFTDECWTSSREREPIQTHCGTIRCNSSATIINYHMISIIDFIYLTLKISTKLEPRASTHWTRTFLPL